MPELKKKSRLEFNEYVRTMADGAGLRDWTLNIAYPDLVAETDRSAGRRWCATSLPAPGRKMVELEFSTDWLAVATAVDIRETVLHELVHCHFGAMVDLVRNDLTDQVSGPAFDVFERGFTRAMEYGVDAVADEWAKHAPMPPPLRFKKA